MPRLSLWKDGKHSNDYKFMDRRISEMFTIGGTGILLHKYLGAGGSNGIVLTTTNGQTAPGQVLSFGSTANVNLGDTVTGTGIPANTTVIAKDATTVTLSVPTTTAVGLDVKVGFSSNAAQPAYTNQSAQNIQDLLLIENRDRKYDPNVYTLRGIYQVADQDFDLSQFGLFLATGTLFMVFHMNDMVDTVGRKIMNGDVLELQHLMDYDPLNQDLPSALKRFFVVGDCSRASEGYSPTWWPHLWRCKLNPLVDSQEYKDILNQIMASDGVTPIGKVLSTYDTTIAINDAVIAEATQNVPKSGYDTSSFYIKPLDTNGQIPDNAAQRTADEQYTVDASDSTDTADESVLSPDAKVHGYLTGDGLAPNGFEVHSGIMFPESPTLGMYALRTDYLPNRLFRFDGKRWVKIEDVQRATQPQTLIGGFMNNNNSYTTYDARGNVTVVQEKQSLSNALRPKADN